MRELPHKQKDADRHQNVDHAAERCGPTWRAASTNRAFVAHPNLAIEKTHDSEQPPEMRTLRRRDAAIAAGEWASHAECSRERLSTNLAGCVFLNLYRAPLRALCVEYLKPAARLADAGEELDRFHRLHRTNYPGERREDAHDRALHFLNLAVLREEAGVAGRLGFAQVEHHQLRVEADRGA